MEALCAKAIDDQIDKLVQLLLSHCGFVLCLQWCSNKPSLKLETLEKLLNELAIMQLVEQLDALVVI